MQERAVSAEVRAARPDALTGVQTWNGRSRPSRNCATKWPPRISRSKPLASRNRSPAENAGGAFAPSDGASRGARAAGRHSAGANGRRPHRRTEGAEDQGRSPRGRGDCAASGSLRAREHGAAKALVDGASRRIKILQTVPCGGDGKFATCGLIKDAVAARENCPRSSSARRPAPRPSLSRGMGRPPPRLGRSGPGRRARDRRGAAAGRGRSSGVGCRRRRAR